MHITTHQLSDGRDVVSAMINGVEFSQTHKTDALRRLCRDLVAAGHSGPANVFDVDGQHRYRVGDIAKAAKWTLAETDRGMTLRKWAPFPGREGVSPFDVVEAA